MGEKTRPSGYFAAITPSDSADLPLYWNEWPRGLYVGGDGNVSAVRVDGVAVTFAGAKAGTVIPISVKRINSTSTTATNLVALY